ncbi:MAG: glycosyltransferase family 2 protein [Pseudomonadales bacterium]|nr:glycosyltransferase family 2 protein [Pseudomonadales bacterium]NRA14018.1 glycosyltransferase family 2 protein [Oceanospirillaceae bacterium]
MFIALLSLTLALWLLILYHHIIYPLILLRVCKAAPKSVIKKSTGTFNTLDVLPSISLLVPAYNEADYIADKIRNLASLDYPSDKLSILIVCDGCTDNTVQIAQQCMTEPENRHLNISVLKLAKNIGKTAILNRFIPQLPGEIVALTDTSALLSMDALLIAAKCFWQTDVDIVAASYQLLAPGCAGESLYWQYQSRIKQAEANTGNPIGMHGALYFFRAKNFISLPTDTINDDFILPMLMVEKGKTAIYCSTIVALELEQTDSVMDHKRRMRIAAGNIQQLIYCSGLLRPIFKGTAVNFFSGKVLRALMPLILLAQMCLCLILALLSPVFLSLALLQLSAILLAWLSIKLQRVPIPILCKLLFYLINGYRYGLLGSWHYLRAAKSGHWH